MHLASEAHSWSADLLTEATPLAQIHAKTDWPLDFDLAAVQSKKEVGLRLEAACGICMPTLAMART